MKPYIFGLKSYPIVLVCVKLLKLERKLQSIKVANIYEKVFSRLQISSWKIYFES